MIVVDSNIVAYLYIEGPATELAHYVRRTTPDWRAPRLLVSEMANLLLGYERTRRLSKKRCFEILDALPILFNQGFDEVNPLEIFELALASECTSYDCEYIALAKNLNVSLVTADKQLLKTFSKVAISLKDFAHS